jgi:predicted protein tyrosine phosphatase
MAIKKVVFISKKEAEVYPAYQYRAVISISDWGAPRAQLESGFFDVLFLEFHDLEMVLEGEPYISFSDEHAKKIKVFVQRAEVNGVEEIIVHCKAGVSRSAAVAKWIAKYYNLAFPEKYNFYNKYVFKILTEVGNEKS